MNKRAFFLSIKILILSIFLTSCSNRKFNIQSSKNSIINENLLKEYVEKFNKNDNEFFSKHVTDLEEFDSSSYFEYINSDIPSPLQIHDSIKALNLFQGGTATNKAGFIIITEEEKINTRPLETQLQLDSNPILLNDNSLKDNLVKLIKNTNHYGHTTKVTGVME